MRTTVVFLSAIACCVVSSTTHAVYEVWDHGEWPKTWSKELEPLRKQSRTLVGPMTEHRHYAISFTTREEFESAWPHILEVKTKGAPVILIRGPNFFLGENRKAGVAVHCPPLDRTGNPANPEAPISGVTNAKQRWMNTTYIELVVDGEVVDLNRVPLPSETPILDERFPRGKTN